jgi:hypothetical protein
MTREDLINVLFLAVLAGFIVALFAGLMQP